MRILQVNTADYGGGAEDSCRLLHEAYRELGHQSAIAVGRKRGDDPDIYPIPRLPLPTLSGRFLQALESRLLTLGRKWPPARRLARWSGQLADPERRRCWREGIEDFEFPGSRSIDSLPPAPPDIIHCHNLHGYYFDLRELPALSNRYPIILNLRDAWHLTGHCAHFFDCQRWRTGCGNCPDLRVYPPVRKDNTAANWRRKADIYKHCRLYVTSPSHWLLDCARNSMLGAVQYRVIPNGIDTAVFRPGSQAQARERLGIRPDDRIVLFVAASTRQNRFKDTATMLTAAERLASGPELPNTRFLCMGDIPEVRGLPGIVSIPFQHDKTRVADYFRAADVYLHAAHAETFPRAITEALACGTPVVATKVGGIPELVRHEQNGLLVPKAQPRDMAAALEWLLTHPERRSQMCAEAARTGAHYTLANQVRAFLSWYEEVIQDFRNATPRQPGS